MSAGETPDILDAWPIEFGFILSSFCLASNLSPLIVLYSISFGNNFSSKALNFFTWSSCSFIYPSYFTCISTSVATSSGKFGLFLSISINFL